MVWVFILGGLLLTAVSGMPLGVGLGLTGLAILHFVVGDATSLASTAIWNVFTDFTLSAVPLYMLMGEILLVSKVSTRIYNGVAPLFHRVPGRLLHTNIAVCTMFGAVCGASMSTAAAVGSVAYSELSERGYNRPLTIGTLAAGGTLGLLIPPSISLLIYGATQNVSIGKLFLAGILPGLMLAGLFMAVIVVQNLRNPSLTTAERRTPRVGEIVIGLLKLWPLSILVFSVLGTIYLGWATPTESAALGVAGALLIGFFWGQLTWRLVIQAIVTSTRVFGTISLIIAGALILAQAISIMGLPANIVGALAEWNVSRYQVLLLIVLIYLVLGCFFDGLSLMLMTLPVVFPVMTAVGFDPVWLGVIITILIEVGMLTPPVGMNLFVLTAISQGQVSLFQAARATIPFWLVLLSGVAILTLMPDIALLLPRLLG